MNLSHYQQFYQPKGEYEIHNSIKYPFEKFASITNFSFINFLPQNSSKIIYISDKNGQYNLWKKSIQVDKNEQLYYKSDSMELTSFMNKVVRIAFPPPVDNDIIFFADEQGKENNHIFKINIDNQIIYPIIEKPSVKYQWGKECFSNDGRFIAYSSNEKKSSNMQLFVRDLKQNETICLTNRSGWYIPGYWSNDNKKISCVEVLTETDSRIWFIDIEKQAMINTIFSDKRSKNEVGPWYDNGNECYVLSDYNKEFIGLGIYDINLNKLKWLNNPNSNIEAVVVSKNRDKLIWSINENGYSKLYLKDSKSDNVSPINTAQGVIDNLRISSDGEAISFLMSNPQSPYNIYLIDLKTMHISKLTNALKSNIPDDIMVKPEVLNYTSFDGLQIPFFLYKPKNINRTQKAGAVISIHGGPISQERPTYAYDGLYQYLANNGIAVLAPNYRGSTGYGRTFEKLIYHDWGGGELKDFEYAAKWLASQEWIDPNRIGVVGKSFGGFAVLSCITRLPDYWKAGVDMFGPSDLITAINTAPSHWRNADKELIGDPEKERDFLRERSPITYVENVKAALLIIQGAHDPRVIKRESDQIVEQLHRFGKNVKYIVFEDEGHGFTKTKNKLKAYQETAKFLIETLS